MRPIREPSKPSKRVRFLMARLERDERFSELTQRIFELGMEFSAPPSMLEDSTAVIAYKMRRQDYVSRQMVSDEE